MALTQQDFDRFQTMIEKAVGGLEKLIDEKLNGHGATVERHSGQINQLYDLDRARVADIAGLRTEVVRLDGKIDANAKVSAVEEQGRDKREEVVEKVTDKAVQKGQFSTATWVSIGLAIIGPIVVALIMGGAK